MREYKDTGVNSFPVAKIKLFNSDLLIEGLMDNTGINRYDKLTNEEKADIQTICDKLRNMYNAEMANVQFQYECSKYFNIPYDDLNGFYI